MPGKQRVPAGALSSLLLFLFLRAVSHETVRDALLAAAVLAVMIYNGGLHMVPITIVIVGTIAACAALIRRRWQPLLLAMLLGIAGFSYAAPKLLPVTLFVTGHDFEDVRTNLETLDCLNVRLILRQYLDPYQNRSLRADDQLQNHRWTEYGNYIGSLAGILMTVSIFWTFIAGNVADRWLGLSFAVTAVVLLLLSAGHFRTIPPHFRFWHLPLSQLRRAEAAITSRFHSSDRFLRSALCRQDFDDRQPDRPGASHCWPGVHGRCDVCSFSLIGDYRAVNGVFLASSLSSNVIPPTCWIRDTLNIDCHTGSLWAWTPPCGERWQNGFTF